ncbi:MAG: hypothetical protein Q9165_002128 [Trypethelium subeluteriae]
MYHPSFTVNPEGKRQDQAYEEKLALIHAENRERLKAARAAQNETSLSQQDDGESVRKVARTREIPPAVQADYQTDPASGNNTNLSETTQQGYREQQNPMEAGYSNSPLPTNISTTPSAPHPNGISPSTAPSSHPRGTKRTRTSSTSPSPPPPPPSHLPQHTPLSPFQHPPAIPPPPFKASDHASDNKSHLLLACTGSVATIKLPLILHALSQHASILSIIVLLTRAATRFLAAQSAEQPHWATLRAVPAVQAVFTDEDEWARPWTRGAPILHVELRRWADLLLVAPLSAAAMGRLVAGIGEDLLGEVCRAWDTDAGIDGPPRFGRRVDGGVDGVGGGGANAATNVNASANTSVAKRSAVGGDMMSSKYATPSFTPIRPAKPLAPVHKRRKVIVVAPAMNTAMWKHPVTKTQMRVLEWDWGVNRDGWIEVLRPQEKALACGDTGDGAMMEWTKIVKVIEDRMDLGKDRRLEEGAERDAKRART